MPDEGEIRSGIRKSGEHMHTYNKGVEKKRDSMERDEYFMAFAIEEAKKALATGEFPVGCVMVENDRVVAGGARENSLGHANEIDHAEIMALRNLASMNGRIDHKNITVYCTMEPCLMCFAALILAGARRIVWAYEDVMGGGTNCDLSALAPLYSSCGVEIGTRVLRRESLELFKEFFSNPHCRYWRGSLLAEYTLRQ